MNQLSHPLPGQDFPAAGPPPGPPNPLMLLHGWLRGRYAIAITLGVLLAIPGAIVGYFAVPPKYSSTGLVHVAPVLPRILYETEQNQQLPYYDAFVATQTTVLTSRRVLDIAAADPQLKEIGWPSGPEGATALQQAIEVSVPRRGTVISVAAELKDPVAAQRAVNAVLRAYATVHEEMTGKNATTKEQALIQRQQSLQLELDGIREQILQRAQEYGTDDLEQLHAAKIDEKIRIEAEIAALELRAAQLGAAPKSDEPAHAEETKPTLEQLIAHDRELAQLFSEDLRLESQERALASLVGPGHKDRKRLAREREALRARIDARLLYLEENPPASLATMSQITNGMTFEQVNEALARHIELRDRINAEAMKIGRSDLAIAALRNRAADVQRALDETATALDRDRLERQNTPGGRVSISQYGELPTAPSTDRRLPLCAFGALAGCGGGVGLVALYGLWRREYRYIDEVERSAVGAPLLGSVPLLAPTDPVQRELAARSVHHLRNVLDLSFQSPQGAGKTFLLTSGGSGDGKTNLTLALGLSFATAGRRTVLVDADLIGRGLTAHLNLKGQAGLAEMFRAGEVNGELSPTSVPNLWAVGAGSDPGFLAEHLDTPGLQSLLQQLRERFDVILVDTGPIMGSLEANLLAPLADRVVVVVSRGQSPRLVNAAVDRIRRLGGWCGGMVFNRATAVDFMTSVSTTSLRSQPDGKRRHPSESAALISTMTDTPAEFRAS